MITVMIMIIYFYSSSVRPCLPCNPGKPFSPASPSGPAKPSGPGLPGGPVGPREQTIKNSLKLAGFTIDVSTRNYRKLRKAFLKITATQNLRWHAKLASQKILSGERMFVL